LEALGRSTSPPAVGRPNDHRYTLGTWIDGRVRVHSPSLALRTGTWAPRGAKIAMFAASSVPGRGMASAFVERLRLSLRECRSVNLIRTTSRRMSSAKNLYGEVIPARARGVEHPSRALLLIWRQTRTSIHRPYSATGAGVDIHAGAHSLLQIMLQSCKRGTHVDTPADISTQCKKKTGDAALNMPRWPDIRAMCLSSWSWQRVSTAWQWHVVVLEYRIRCGGLV